MKRTTIKFIATCALAASATGLLSMAQAQTKLKWAHVYETSESYHKQSVWAAEEIKKRSNGKFDIQVFPASTLGKESDLTMKTINGQKYYFLMPNKRVVVSGLIKIVDKNQFNPISPFFWVGLYHEQVRIVNDRIAPTRVTIGF